MADFGPTISDRLAAYDLVTCTPHATAHTKGSWSAAFGGGSAARSEGFILRPSLMGTMNTLRSLLVDVGIGASQAPLISNLLVTPSHFSDTGTAVDCSQGIYFPVAIPAGESLYVRAQASIASHEALEFNLIKLRSGDPWIGSVIDTYGADETNTRGVNCLQQSGVSYGWGGSYYELTASCKRIKAFVLAVGHGGADWSSDPGFFNQRYSIRLAIGAAGSEVELLTIQDAGGTTDYTRAPSQMFLGPYGVDIEPGTRIAAKVSKQGATTDVDHRTLSLVMYGIR